MRSIVLSSAIGLLILGPAIGVHAEANLTAPQNDDDAGEPTGLSASPAVPSSTNELASNPCEQCDQKNNASCDDCPTYWWARLEYIGLWVEGTHVPALVTTSPNGTAKSGRGFTRRANLIW